MKNTKRIVLYIVWACLYILCVGLGMLEATVPTARALLLMIALAFFVPGFWLAAGYLKEECRKGLGVIRTICICSLSLTALALVGNFLSARAGAELGNALYDALALVSAPMLCAQYWAVSIFMWACLLMITLPGVILPKK